MNGESAVFDTNVFIYFLEGKEKAKELFNHFSIIYFSVITRIELLSASHLTEDEYIRISQFLETCLEIPLQEGIIQAGILFRRKYKMKIPDALILAAAFQIGVPLLSADNDHMNRPEIDFIQY